LRELPREQITNVATSRAACIRLMTDEVADLSQRQTMRLGLFDEPHSVDGAAVILTETAAGSPRSRQQPLAFVVPQRVAREATRRRKLSNPHHA